MTQASPEDLRWLDAAVRYATSSSGNTAEVPTAAALIVDPLGNTLVSRAVTAKGGRPHAEAQALEAAGFSAAGATLYTTIEPCCHWGRSPPCVDAIVRSGIMRVVIGLRDPDPQNAGQGVQRLESAGVEVILADHAPSRRLHAGHVSRHMLGRPEVKVMLVVADDDTLIDPKDGPARGWLDLMRSRSDALLLGAASARGLAGQRAIVRPGLESRTPLRVVLAGADGVDRGLNLIGGFSGHRTAVIAETAAVVDAPVSVEVIRVAGKTGRPDLGAGLAALAAKGIQSVLVEAGPRLLTALLEADLVDSLVLVRCAGQGQGGPRATPDGLLVDLIDAAGLVAERQQTQDAATITIYRRPA
ncbi:MAG: dihydrofolate reductase family protein [Alphaproteobacteria bacterium]|nr:dihydrofolate reductase family protein [Alphaproteobacteria bacterium]